MVIPTLLVPVFMAEEHWLAGSELWGVAFLVVVYACVVTAIATTIVRNRSEQRDSLAQWRRIPYVIGLAFLSVLCLLPLVAWPIALSGMDLHLRYAVLCLFGANVAAVILIWFGSGWARIGLTVAGYWICFLWAFPFAMRG
jgi:hypothetical protein